ncbi:MAG: Tex family protein [Desulfobacterales bacterium]|nr:Tex family protein [Desulfobacterales bacterium]MDX2511970.1 Tex family protein [Desulfobacterales bacterium]
MHPDTSITTIAKELSIKDQQVDAVAGLLSDGSTIPFIARYRKEITGSLDEVIVTAIRDRLNQLRDLGDRQVAILKSLEKHGHLTDELHQKVLETQTMAVLEDLYLPFKPKRRTKAVIAKEKGLEPLAHLILEQNNIDPAQEAAPYVDPEKKVETIEDALAGARDIIAEIINENDETRSQLRNLFFAKAKIKSRVVVGMEETGAKFKDYFDWEESIAKVPSHRMLAMRRGEKENILILDISPAEEDAIAIMEAVFVKGGGADSTQVKLAVMDGYKRLLSHSMETEARMYTKTRADSEAIRVFAENLRQLLLSPPLGAKRVMGIDPGFRTGCKVACLDRQGTLLHHDTIYPHMSQKKALEDTAKIKTLCNQFQTEAIAVGNGTAGRETEAFVKAVLPPEMVQVLMVNESGASVYSASEVAREEFPDHDLTVRGAVSIGRRLMDPLAELVKIDPKSIGVCQYQHDVDQTALKQTLDDVVMSGVNNVGVDLNRASAQLLTYVSGLNAGIAKNIVLHRDTNGPFGSRKQLLKVSRLGPKAFEQSAGFLRIMDGKNPLDASAVHPESYAIVDAMSKDLKSSITDMMKKPDLRTQIDLPHYVSATVGIPTLNDILDELAKPGRDPRKTFEAFSFTDGIEKVADLRKGMQLPGIVTNITAFGAFVDIGVHQDGLVHISQMADRFVKNPADIVKVQQQVLVTILDVDMDRNRIALSMKKAVDPEEKKTRKKNQTRKPKNHPGKPKPEKKHKTEKKPAFQGSLAEALLKSGLK